MANHSGLTVTMSREEGSPVSTLSRSVLKRLAAVGVLPKCDKCGVPLPVGSWPWCNGKSSDHWRDA